MTPPSAPHPNARDRQRQETREHILRAVARQLEAGEMEDVSFAEIARDAGVGERTVYRHFPTKEALLGAFWSWMQAQAQAQAQALVQTPERPKPAPQMPRIRESIKATRDSQRPM